MAEFNANILQEYYNTRNYAGAAEYLRSTPAKDYKSQLKVNDKIHQLETLAAKETAMLNYMDDDQSQAYNFMQGLNSNGTIPSTKDVTVNNNTVHQNNKYGDKYLSYINNLTSQDGKPVTRIGIMVDNDDAVMELANYLGYNDIKDNNLGIQISKQNNGKTLLGIDTNNKNLSKVLLATKDIEDRNAMEWLRDFGNVVGTQTVAGAASGMGIGAMIGGVGAAPGTVIGSIAGASVGLYNFIKDAISRNKYSIHGMAKYDKKYKSVAYNSKDLDKAMNVVRDAQNRLNEVQEKVNANTSVDEELQSFNFLGAGHAEAYQAYKQHKLSLDDYNKITKNWEDCYNKLITASDFTKKDVYAWSAASKEGRRLQTVDNQTIPALQGEVLLAMKEDRVSYNLAICGGDIGTLITITPKNDDNADGFSKQPGEIYKQIWVKGLFEGSAEQAFNVDTKYKSAKENADMKHYNYEKRLSTGVTIGYKPNLGAYKKETKDGYTNMIPISEADALHYLNEGNIIEDAALTVLNYVQHDKNSQPDVIDKIKILAVNAVNELYPTNEATTSEREYYTNYITRSISELVARYSKMQNQD